jgi:branched-subunit amino acid transport protein
MTSRISCIHQPTILNISALVLPDLLNYGLMGPFSILMHARLIAGPVAVVVAWRTRNIVLTIGTGFPILLMLQNML